MAAVKKKPHVVIIGAGFSGLAAGYELCRRGIGVTLLEKDAEIGGLAGSFQVDGRRLEKFYHHWFSHDTHIMSLINELSLHENVILRPTRTGMYYGKKLYRLSSPVDLIGFKPLSVRDRIRLSLLALSAHRVKDWRDLENVSATEWLKQMAGDNVYAVVWEPLLRGKF